MEKYVKCLENSVGGKYGRSEEASFVFFVPSCLEFISNEHTCWVSSLEMITGNCLCMSALALQLKILLEGNMGNHKKLHVVSLSTYVWNCCVMKILYGCLRLK